GDGAKAGAGGRRRWRMTPVAVSLWLLVCDLLRTAAESEEADDRPDHRDPARTLCPLSSPDSAPVRIDRRSGRGFVPQPGPANVGRPGLDRRGAIQLRRGGRGGTTTGPRSPPASSGSWP